MGINILNRIGKVLNHNIDKFIEAVVETRKNFNQKALVYNSSGEDSPPCKDDKVILLKTDGTGKYVLAGVLTESQGAKPGEKIFFARSEDGKKQSSISMKGSGDITGEAEGNFSLTIKGDIQISGANIEVSGDSVTISGTQEIILSTIGSAAWVPNCIPTCPFGIPHGGPSAGITGLKGQ